MTIKEKRDRLQRLFGQLCEAVKLDGFGTWEADIRKYHQAWLKLDFNSIYGGYRIDIVNPDTSESFFDSMERRSLNEMTAYIEGFLKACKQLER